MLLVLCSNFINLKLILFMRSFGLLGHFVVFDFAKLDEGTLKNILLLFKPEFGILKLIDLFDQLLIFLLVLFNDTYVQQFGVRVGGYEAALSKSRGTHQRLK